MQHRYARLLAEEMEKNPFCPLVDAIYHILLRDIISYKYKSGDKLKESKLAEEFGVSRTPIRAALCLLLEQGMLEKGKNAAAVVASYTPREWSDLIDIRICLETRAASLAAERMSDAEYKELERLMEQLRSACHNHEIERAYEMEQSFHEHIILCSHNRFLIAAYNELKPHITRSRLYFTASVGFYDFFVPEHDLITAVFKLRNPLMAEAAMKRHLSLLNTDKSDQLFADPTKLMQLFSGLPEEGYDGGNNGKV